MREKVLLICSECLSRNYTTTVNRATQKDRLELKKYCAKCNKMTLHKQSKQEATMGLKKYSSEVIKEGKRVRWPKRSDLFSLILTVLFVVLFAAFFLMIEDLAASSMLGALEEVFESMRG